MACLHMFPPNLQIIIITLFPLKRLKWKISDELGAGMLIGLQCLRHFRADFRQETSLLGSDRVFYLNDKYILRRYYSQGSSVLVNLVLAVLM